MKPAELTLRAIAAVLALGLSACVSDAFTLPDAPTGPATVYSYGWDRGADSAGMHTVEAGDTPWIVAQRYHLSLQDLIAVNDLQPPYRLAPGTRLRLPPPATYNARAGDTLYSISHTFSVSPTQLAQLNNLQAPYAVSPGETIRLPSVHPATLPESSPAYAPPAQGTAPVIMPDTAYAPVAPVTITPDTQNEVDQDIASEPPLPASVTATKTAPGLLPPPALSVADGGNGRFAWPVNGPVISGYGPKPGGLHNDGINIRAAQGAPVHAAENGVVVYAGNELKGFGNLVLLRHADRWMTAYAHMDSLAVKRGDNVMRGQTIGAVGMTGGVSEPQLHFEVRRGTEALNPAIFLARQGT